jgi:hypothetical protein
MRAILFLIGGIVLANIVAATFFPVSAGPGREAGAGRQLGDSEGSRALDGQQALHREQPR